MKEVNATHQVNDQEWQIVPKVWNVKPPKGQELENLDGKPVEIDLDPRMPETQVKIGAAGDTLEIQVDEADATKVLKVGMQLPVDIQEALVAFLKRNLDVFAWCHSDMVGIDPKNYVSPPEY